MKFQLKRLAEFTQIPPSVLRALQEGDENPEISNLQELSLFYYYLEQLKRNGLLIYQTPLIELSPFNGDFRCQKEFDGNYRLSRFALCRHEEGEIVVETPLSPARVHIRSSEGLHFFFAFREPLSLEEAKSRFPHLPGADVEDAFALLCSAHIFSKNQESVAMRQWEFHDLFFHSRSRLGRQDAPFGGTFRFRETLPSLPALKTCTGTTFELPKPQHELELPLGHTIGKRKSIREHGEKPITVRQLGEFLYHAARVREFSSYGDDELTKRPYPGGGARYELEIYPVVNNCEGLDPGVYHYHPSEHRLCVISPLDESAERLLIDANKSTGKNVYPQILFVIGARFQRVAWKYQSMAYALVLKNTGILMQTFYLVATAMGLAPCGVGGGDSDLFCKVVGTDYLEETSVGEFILGSRPESEERRN